MYFRKSAEINYLSNLAVCEWTGHNSMVRLM